MTFNQILPFVVYAVVKKRRIESLKKILAEKRLIKSKLIDDSNIEMLTEQWNPDRERFVNVIQLIPNDIYFLQDEVEVLSEQQLALVTELDYSDVAKRIKLFFNNEVAGYELGNGLYNFSYVVTSKYIDDAKQGLITANLDDLYKESYMTESVKDPKTSKLYARISSGSTASVSLPEFVRAVKSYLMSNSLTSQIPMLIGFSGVAKSAIIKDLTKELDSYYQSSNFKNSTITNNREYSSINGTTSLVLSDEDKASYLGFSRSTESRIQEFDKLNNESINNMIRDYNASLLDAEGLNKVRNRNFRIVVDNGRICIDTEGKSFLQEDMYIDCSGKPIDDLVKIILVKEFIESSEILSESKEFDNMVNSGEISKQDRDQYAFEKFKDMRQYGMRMVDVRCAFLSPFDLEGLNIIKDSDIGDPVGMSAPFDKFMLCTDEFINFARAMIKKIEQVLDEGKVNNHQLTVDESYKLEQALERCKYYAKIPVLFFDEITRCLTGDTKVKLLNGTIMTMKEIYDTYGTTEEFYVYSVDNNGKLVPGKARSLGVTRRNAQLIEVKLDNKQTIRCTPEHLFLLRNGNYKRADMLEKGDSLSAMYFVKGMYEGVFVSDKQKGLTHQLIAATISSDYKTGSGLIAHHIDEDTHNNEPTNIRVCTRGDHAKYHINNLEDISEAIGIATEKINQETELPINHSVESVSHLTHREDVYDLEVRDYHNFLIYLESDDSGIIVHNCDRGIQGALTTIINQRRFLGRYNLKLARMVSATNAPVGRGYENDEDLSNFFVKTRMGDKAMLDRFIRYKVAPEDVYQYWIKWAEGEGNIHHHIIEYIKTNGQAEIAYNVEPAIKKAKEGYATDDMIPAYPTYRAWEMISDYLKNYEERISNNSGTIFNKDIIKGTLGFEVNDSGEEIGAAIDFCNWLEDIGFIDEADVVDPVDNLGNRVDHPYRADEGDVMAQVMEDALEAGLPVMLMGIKLFKNI